MCVCVFVRVKKMEVFQTENFYIFVKKEKSLWWNRTTSEFSVKAGNYPVNNCNVIILSIRAAIAACQSVSEN